MDELGWVEMSDIEKSLNYAEKGWDKDTRGLENPTLYLQELIKDKLKLYESKHLSGAVKALNAVKDELAENEARYQSVKALFDEAKTLTPKEAKGEAGRKFVVISKANDEIKKALNTDTDDIRLSAWTIFSHLKREKITAFDYSIVRFMDKSYKTHKGNKGESIVDYYYLGIYYRAVFKKTTKNEIYLDSLVASDREI